MYQSQPPSHPEEMKRDAVGQDAYPTMTQGIFEQLLSCGRPGHCRRHAVSGLLSCRRG